MQVRSNKLYEVLVMLPTVVTKETDVAGINYNIAATNFLEVQTIARELAYKESVAIMEQKGKQDITIPADEFVVESVQAKGIVWVPNGT